MAIGMRTFGTVTLLGLAATLLTACDPPMPPDVAAQIAEQTFTCVEGSVTLAAPANLADPVSQWQASVAGDCVDPLPAMTFDGTAATPDLAISSTDPSADLCKPFAKLPFAVESADLLFNLSVTTSLVLSPQNIADIYSGKITTWADPSLQAENNGTELPDEPIIINSHESDIQSVQTLNAWFTKLGAPLPVDGIQAAVHSDSSYYADLAEGEIAVVPGSAVTEQGLAASSVLVGKAGSKHPLVAVPDNQGISSAATQWKSKNSGNNVSVSLDYSATPVAPVGFDSAATPYQAITPVNLYLCGDDTLLKRAAGLFLLRLDSQGVLGASNYNQLAESVRETALLKVRKGLPIPKVKQN